MAAVMEEWYHTNASDTLTSDDDNSTEWALPVVSRPARARYEE